MGALVLLSIMGFIQNLIICVRRVWSKHLAGSDCGDKYSLNMLYKSAICFYVLSDTSNSRMKTVLLLYCTLFVTAFSRCRIAALFYTDTCML